MFAELQKIYNVVLVIALIAVFVDANDLTEFSTITPTILTATTTIETKIKTLETTTSEANSTWVTTITSADNITKATLDYDKTKQQQQQNKLKHVGGGEGVGDGEAKEVVMNVKEEVHKHQKLKLHKTNEQEDTTKTTTIQTIITNNEKQEKALNIVDLYPLPMANFKPIIKAANTKLIQQQQQQQQQQQHIVFKSPKNVEEHRQNFLPNDVELIQQQQKLNHITDFTGKLLAEEDGGVITEIEQKFRINDGVKTTTTIAPITPIKQHIFIDRRFKKSFDFGNTKFSKLATNDGHPEFSTTKFYNSKELYNEMMQHNTTTKLQTDNNSTNHYAVLTNPQSKTFRKSSSGASVASSALGEVVSAEALPTHATNNNTKQKSMNSSNAAALERIKLRLKAILPTTLTSTTPTTTNLTLTNTNTKTTTTTKTNSIAQGITKTSANANVSNPTTTTTPTTFATKISHNISTTSITSSSRNNNSIVNDMPKPTTTITTITTITNSKMKAKTKMAITTTPIVLASTTTTMTNILSQHRATNPTKSSSKPISRPRILSQLQQKINALECEIANMPQDAHLWRGNETHELLLPIMVSII